MTSTWYDGERSPLPRTERRLFPWITNVFCRLPTRAAPSAEARLPWARRLRLLAEASQAPPLGPQGDRGPGLCPIGGTDCRCAARRQGRGTAGPCASCPLGHLKWRCTVRGLTLARSATPLQFFGELTRSANDLSDCTVLADPSSDSPRQAGAARLNVWTPLQAGMRPPSYDSNEVEECGSDHVQPAKSELPYVSRQLAPTSQS